MVVGWKKLAMLLAGSVAHYYSLVFFLSKQRSILSSMIVKEIKTLG